MSEKKACLRCQRGIDAWARICPYCNWNQNNTTLPEPAAAPPAVVYEPPSLEAKLKKKAVYAVAGVLLLFVAFGIGMIINRDGAPKNAPETLEEQAAEQNKVAPAKRADTPLVPMNEPGGIEQPVTSAPVAAPAGGGAMPDAYQRTDATAVSAAEYAQLAKRAQAEKQRQAAFVDPRAITGAAYAQGVPPRPPQRRRTISQQVAQGGGSPAMPVSRVAARTNPVPQYQPIPPIRARGTARLSLMVGADGRVKNVGIDQPLAGGNTVALLRSVQNWRFKPAMQNGQAVAAPYTVEISFGRND